MIAILGGTFDPIHFGHLRPALEIFEKLSLSELRFIPSAKPPHRWQPEASAKDRLKMVQKAIKAMPYFTLDDREYLRLQQDNVSSFTIDTVRSIREEIGEHEPLCMIVGMDAFQSFTSWRDWQDILNTVHLIVASRPGYDDKEKSQDWVQQRIETDLKALHEKPSGNVYFCAVTQLDISATMIRNQVNQGKSCRYLTPKNVDKYIKKKNLYASWS